MKYLIAMALLAIVASLGAALFFMMRGPRQGSGEPRPAHPMVRALALRVALSVVLFVCILLAWKFGYIQPTGIPAGA